MPAAQRIAPTVEEPIRVEAEIEALSSAAPLNVLIVAYACNPAMGSEHFLGWEWVKRLSAKHCVTVITWSDSVGECESRHCDGLRVVGVDESKFRFLRRFGWPGFYLFYWIWQLAAARLGRQLLASSRFDIIHQLTFHTFRFGGRLAKPEHPPFIWGPIAGLESIPTRMFPLVGFSLVFEAVRQVSNWLSPYAPSVRRTLRNAHTILVSNEDTLLRLKRQRPQGSFVLFPANAVPAMPDEQRCATEDGLLMLGLGEFRRMRAHTLIFEALAQMEPVDRNRCRLVMVGGGPASSYLERRSRKLGLQDVVEFKGLVPREEAKQWMLTADLLVFPSLRDSGGSAICESLALGLPVLAMNRAGPASLLRDGGGFLIEARSRRKAAADIRQKLVELLSDKSPLDEASARGREVAQHQFGWDAKVQAVNEIYLRAALQEEQRRG